MTLDTTNRNTLWASIMVDELARNGVQHAVISPGSRSTPLTMAFSRDERITVHSVLDERAAAFFALGSGLATEHPAVLVCTSGTAAANYYPAIIEANQSHVPLIAMTADRPHELRDSGANQTVDQVKLYGDRVRWFVDVALPEALPPDRTLRYLRTTICRAVAAASAGGPVHLNVPFRKPLEPTPTAGDVPAAVMEGIGAQGRTEAFSTYATAVSMATDSAINRLAQAIAHAQRGLIVCGQGTIPGSALITLAEMTGFPLLAEPLSGMRYYGGINREVVFGGYETYLRDAFAPDLIIQFGQPPVGASLLKYLARQTDARRIVIGPRWADGDHLTAEVIPAHQGQVLTQLLDLLHPREPSEWLAAFQQAEHITREVIAHSGPHEGSLLRDIVDALPPHAWLFVASSNPVRHLDQFALPQAKGLTVFANRGASGIDGTVASALGASVSAPQVMTLVIGDIALYHDLNSLHLIRRLGLPLIVVCINNDGGGIFHRLPIADHDPPFTAHFTTPHGLTFEHAAALFDIPYTRVAVGEGFRQAFGAALEAGEAHLIEVPSDAAAFEGQRRSLIAEVHEHINNVGILPR